MTPHQRWTCAWSLAVLIPAASWAYSTFHRVTPLPLNLELKLLPLTIGDWHGYETDRASIPFTIDSADEELTRLYRRHPRDIVLLYIAYFASQQQGRELQHYLSRKFHRGATEVEIPLGDALHRINRAVWREERSLRVVHFWYDVNGRIVTGRIEAKLLTLLDGLVQRRTNGALILVATPPSLHTDTTTVTASELAFLQALFPILRSHLRAGSS